MNKIWIFAIALWGIIGGACSNDVASAHEESSDSSSIIIIELSSSEEITSSYSRSTKTVIQFSNKAEPKTSSSSKQESSSSTKVSSSSSSKPKSSSSVSSSSVSSSSVQSSSSSGPKSSTSLDFYDCNKYDCVIMDYLNPDISYGEMLDKRDNQVYRTLVISNHVWTAQNMNYEIKTEEGSETTNWCYNDDPEYCKKFGRFYKWEAALEVCPEGWHLPTTDEWAELLTDHACEIEKNENHPEYYYCAGTSLKAIDSWEDGTPNTNEFGFTVIAAGIRIPKGSTGEGVLANFWTSTDAYSDYAGFVDFGRVQDYASILLTYKYYGLSVRCVKGDVE